jgi:hypothetical protein
MVHPEGVWYAFHERVKEFERFIQEAGLPQRWQLAVGVGPAADGSSLRDRRRLRALSTSTRK